MCGIAGIYNFSEKPADHALIEGMTKRLIRRGPDGGGVWVEGRAALGHRRLAIRDLSPAGAQPFHSACGQIVVAYNGELYNDREIADTLGRTRGFVARTGCDTEVIPESYLEWGEHFVERLEGIFAIALYDRRDGTLLLARDGNGTKPLYIRMTRDGLHFASETKAFLADSAFSPAFDPAQLSHMLALGYVAPAESLILGVRQLAPGTCLVIDRQGLRERRFWRPLRAVEPSGSLDHSAERVIDTLRGVVLDQIVSDVPLAVLQSGGIDSTLISACLPEKCDVRLFSVRFADRSHDESELAGTIAGRLKRPISFIDLARADVLQDFRMMVDAVDGALADSSALATFQLARAVSRYATVALSGDGADEYFGGYPTYRTSAITNRLKPLLFQAGLRRASRIATSMARPSDERIGKGEILVRLLDGMASASPHASWRRYLRDANRPDLYGVPLKPLIDSNPLAGYAEAGADGRDAWEKGLLADQRYYLPGDMLIKTDRTSMYHGLEVRVPFLDRRMCELAGGIDRRQLVDIKGGTKIVLRRAAERLGLPAEVFRARKMGFNLPMNALLRNELQPHGDRLLDRHADILEPHLSADSIRRIWREHREQKRDHRFTVWTLLVLATFKEDTLSL
ncbi:asparagine synthase (glutamine-hydrolyzing) [Rhizobium leguminosarum]|uniref:asparagine synthase (glutamine-hydrolyzing) n=2 Tax=Rhizobium TaxID=379 RepID=UPI0024756589|nr:asparagine synthase (glutamine-hydrolyzing) [Rhizobium leguminosarum]MDH6275173.1 asparagine synthase (glutamine-hydrolyzing) [Rhizobium leguminosarum]